MKSELERYKEALAGARHALGMIQRNPKVMADDNYINAVQKELDAILNPPPEMEEVEVVRYVVAQQDGTITWEGSAIPGYFADQGEQLVKLTGTVKRPKPQPMDRKMLISSVKFLRVVESTEGNIFRFQCGVDTAMSQSDADAIAEIFGKTGTLTFTWTEAPK